MDPNAVVMVDKVQKMRNVLLWRVQKLHAKPVKRWELFIPVSKATAHLHPGSHLHMNLRESPHTGSRQQPQQRLPPSPCGRIREGTTPCLLCHWVLDSLGSFLVLVRICWTCTKPDAGLECSLLQGPEPEEESFVGNVDGSWSSAIGQTYEFLFVTCLNGGFKALRQSKKCGAVCI